MRMATLLEHEGDLASALRHLLGALGGAAVVFHQELDVRTLEFGERHFSGVFHRLCSNAGVALCG